MKKTFSRALSVFLAVVMLAVSVPVAFASTPIALKASNVTVWPTAEGEIYYGEPLSKIKLIGGEVQYNGTVVPGHFEHVDPTVSAEEAMDAYEADIKFVPDDTTSYKGFTKLYSKTTFTVHKTTPVLADETKPPIVTTIVEPGVSLSTITISDGAMINPYDPNETTVKKITWKWTDPNTIVNESGYYEAKFVASTVKYVVVKQNIYVEVNSPVSVPTIIEYPTIPELYYDPNVTWADIPLEGGKAVIKGTETEVEGTFTIKDTRKDVVPNPNFTEIEIVFTPANAEEALPYEFTIPVTVNPSPLTFVDDEGNPVEDFTFEVEPGVKMNDVKALIQANLRTPKNAVISVEDNNGYAENGRKYKLTVLHDDPYYIGTELYFTVKFKETEITPTLKWAAAGQLKVDCGEYSPSGTFSVYFIIGETETKIGDVKGNSEILEWTPKASGNYNFKVVYTPAENDYFVINNVTTTPYSYYPEHKVISTGNSVATYKMGETATVTAVPTDPEKLDKPYYGFTGWTDVKGNTGLSDEDLANETVSFTMPDEDVELKANYKFSIELFFEWVLAQITQFFTFIVNAVKDLIALA